MSEEISKEDILNVTGNMFDTFLDYVDNSNNKLEQLKQENNQLKDRINKAVEYMDKMTEKELNYITYKGEEYLVCGSDFGEGAWIIEEILKGDKE